MTRFDGYLLSRLTVNFGFFALVMVAIYWVNSAVGLFDELIADGQSALVFLEFTALTLPNVIRIVLPVAGFAAALQVANRLRGDSELVVAGAAGLSPLRVLRGALAFGLLLALLVGLLVHWLTPLSKDRLAERSAEISRDTTARVLKPGAFVHPADGLTFYVREIAPDGGLLDVFVSDARGPSTVDYVARTAYVARPEGVPHLVMTEGEAQEVVDGRLRVTRFTDLSYDISDLAAAASERRQREKDRTTAALLSAGPTGEGLLEIHRRLAESALSVAAVLLGFAAMTLGAFSRFGAGPQVALAIVSLILLKVAEGAALDAMDDLPARWWLHHAAPALGFALAGAMIAVASAPARRVRPA